MLSQWENRVGQLIGLASVYYPNISDPLKVSDYIATQFKALAGIVNI